MITTLLSGKQLNEFSEAYFKLSNLDVPISYLERSSVFGFYIDNNLIGGFILAKSYKNQLRTIEFFSSDREKRKLYKSLKRLDQYLEVTCFWLARKYRRRGNVRSRSWVILASKIVKENKDLVIYGTNNNGLAKLYSYPKTSTLLHRDNVNNKDTFIFITTRKGFYNIFEIAFSGVIAIFKKKKNDIEVKPKSLGKIKSRMK